MADNSLMPVVVGGLLALSGIAVTGAITLAIHWLQSGAEKKKRRAEKFEELVSAIYQFDHWVDILRNIQVYGEEHSLEASPFAKIQAITAIYFPAFDKAVSDLDTATAIYRVWMSGAGLKRLNNEIGKINDGFAEAFKPYNEKRDALLSELKKFAHKEFQ